MINNKYKRRLEQSLITKKETFNFIIQRVQKAINFNWHRTTIDSLSKFSVDRKIYFNILVIIL